MIKKSGLGKGLDALIPETDSADNSIIKIKLNLIKPNENQPRRNFDEEKIVQLADSIKEHGIIQPLVLKKENDLYTIVAGERRWRASKILGLDEVPAIIMDLSEKDILEVSLIENIQREDLNPIEEANAYKELINRFNFTQEDLAKRIGKSRVAITNTLRLLNLDERVQDYIIEGIISEGHGRALLSINNKDKQYEISQFIIDNKLSVRETEKYISNLQNKNVKNKKIVKKDLYYVNIQKQMESALGTKVLINNKKNKGKIEIEYYSLEDFERILDLLNFDVSRETN